MEYCFFTLTDYSICNWPVFAEVVALTWCMDSDKFRPFKRWNLVM